MNWKNAVPVAWLNAVPPIWSSTASTIVGVEMSSRQRNETIRSPALYCRTAHHAPTATPPAMPMMAPMVTRRMDTPIRVPSRALIDSPCGVQPQFQWPNTISSQRTYRVQILVSGLML